MQRTRFGDMVCSIAPTLEVAGEPWSPLSIRDGSEWRGRRRGWRFSRTRLPPTRARRGP